MHSSYLRVTGNLVWLSLVFSSLSVGQSNLRESVLGVLTWNTFNLPTIAGEMGQIDLDATMHYYVVPVPGNIEYLRLFGFYSWWLGGMPQ